MQCLCCNHQNGIALPSRRSELYGKWDYDEFRQLHLKEYMVMCEVSLKIE